MYGFSSKSIEVISLLYEECRQPRKQSSEQKAQSKQNVQNMRDQGGGFDKMSDSKHKSLSKEGGQSERKRKPEC